MSPSLGSSANGRSSERSGSLLRPPPSCRPRQRRLLLNHKPEVAVFRIAGLVRLLNLKVIGLAIFAVVAAVAAALGCPVFRNPGTYASAGGAVGYLKYVVDVHRKR